MDGRGIDEIRPITVEVGLLPRAHGSGLFTRGQTQALTVATLGPSSDVQRIDTIGPESREALHPPLQHAALLDRREQAHARPRPARDRPRRARRAGLLPVLPATEEFPYVIRVGQRVRDVERLDVDGLDLRLDARADGCRRADQGAGRRCGDGPDVGADGKFAVLTDILGKEDAFGDMDFKVTGTRDGITALQMDIKVKGINEAIIRDGLEKARVARLIILDKMLEVMPDGA